MRVDEATLTPHQIEARARYAAACELPANRWRVVGAGAIEPGCWYDWCDPATRKHGQCCMGDGGVWRQEPRGDDPVVLEYRKGGWR